MFHQSYFVMNHETCYLLANAICMIVMYRFPQTLNYINALHTHETIYIYYNIIPSYFKERSSSHLYLVVSVIIMDTSMQNVTVPKCWCACNICPHIPNINTANCNVLTEVNDLHCTSHQLLTSQSMMAINLVFLPLGNMHVLHHHHPTICCVIVHVCS